jgi:hypothetical protein
MSEESAECWVLSRDEGGRRKEEGGKRKEERGKRRRNEEG